MHANQIPWSLPPAPTVDAPTLEDFAVEAATDATTYRELLQAAIAELSALTKAHVRLRTQHHALIEQYRALLQGVSTYTLAGEGAA